MGDTSVFWLRVTLALYSLGLLHALHTVIRRRQKLFPLALASFTVAAVFHLVSLGGAGSQPALSLPRRHSCRRFRGELLEHGAETSLGAAG